jgi:di/tricarboxylate transporter
MTASAWLLIAVILVPLIFVVFNRLRLDVAALLMAVSLGILQLIGVGIIGPAHTPQDVIKALSGFGEPVVITLISLFILSRGLEKSGLMRWIAHNLLKLGKNNERSLIGLLALTTGIFSLFMNNIAAGVLLLPSAMEVSRRTGIKPSRLLIPVAFGGLLGGMATYFTTANIIMSNLLTSLTPPEAPLTILNFLPTGGFMALAGVLFLTIFGPFFLPQRESPSAEKTLQRITGSELESMYHLKERMWEVRIQSGSPVVGRSLEEIGFGKRWGITIVAIRKKREDYLLPEACQKLMSKDVLLVLGKADNIEKLKELKLKIDSAEQNGFLSPHGFIFSEVILSPHSKAQGQNLKEMHFRQRFGLNVVAIHRGDEIERTNIGDIKLLFGDTLLAVGTVSEFEQLKKSPDFIVFDPDPGDQPVDIRMAVASSVLMLSAIIASILGIPVYISVLTAAVLSMILGVMQAEEAYQTIEWQTVFIVAGMYVVSQAMVNTGLAVFIGNAFTNLLGRFGLVGVSAGAYLLTTLLTQIMGGQVTALVTGPIMLSAALLTHVNPHAVAVATAIGCSASFLTPMSHPILIIMIAPANYRFSDFFRSGWPLFIFNFFTLIAAMLLFWK